MQNKISQLLIKDKKYYLITSFDHFENENDFLNTAAAALNKGIDILELKPGSLCDKKTAETGKKIRELTSLFNALFIINSRIDIAHFVDSDGVHLDQEDLPICCAKDILGHGKIAGLSVYEENQAQKAIEQNADYLIIPQHKEFTAEIRGISIFVKSQSKEFDDILKDGDVLLERAMNS